MSLSDAAMRLRGFLYAGRSYENRGGKHDFLDDDIEVALDMLEWANDPESAKEDETERYSHAVTHDIAVDFEAREGDDQLDEDLRIVGGALRKAGF